MLVKLGVDTSKLKPPIRKKLNRVDAIFHTYGYEAIVSSTYEGDHSAGSLHYAHLAIDFRTRLLKRHHVDLISLAIRDELGRDYDVVVEASHIHIEYDPKGCKA